MPAHHRLAATALLGLVCTLAAWSAQGQTLAVRPGQWTSTTEIWINGKAIGPDLAALQQRIRTQLTPEQQRQLDRETGRDSTACLTPAQSKVDLRQYIESLMRGQGPWECSLSNQKLEPNAFTADYQCGTSGGGHQRGKATAGFGPLKYRLELLGRGNAVDGRTGESLGTPDVDLRLLSSGQWVGAQCAP